MEFTIKICGLLTAAALDAALDAGADMVGLNFHPRSPRRVELDVAAGLARQAAGRALTVALVVDADDARLSDIASVVKPDMWQFHGTESPARIAQVRERHGLPVMKVLGVASADDLAAVSDYAGAADHILLDAKPPKDAAYPGGHGQAFDWAVLKALPTGLRFMLAGGLTSGNVAEAIAAVRAQGLALAGVDVASGVESAPGVKDPDRIRAFIANARRAAP